MISSSRLLLAGLAFLSTGCDIIHIPGHCCNEPHALQTKAALLPQSPADNTHPFVMMMMQGGKRNFKVFIPRESLGLDGQPRADYPPILLCHEMMTLGPQALQLAQRLAHEKFAVYVPVLFGNEKEDPDSTTLAIRRSFSMAFENTEWNANALASERPITAELADLCRNEILPRHKGKLLGVIGLCVSGILPVELLGQNPPITQLAAPVISQPAMPVLASNYYGRQSLGISELELARAKGQVADRQLQILGFRFQLDQISPPERFARLKSEFRDRFIDATLPASDYVYRDHCPPNTHAVLTDGYCTKKSPDGHETRGHFAYRQLLWFLNKKLKGIDAPPPLLGGG
jgi:dienelactone hydrolase